MKQAVGARRLMDPHNLKTSAHAKAGPMYFALNSYSTFLRSEDEDLAAAGKLLFPMIYNHNSDRFDAVEWACCFHEIAQGCRRMSWTGARGCLSWRCGASIRLQGGQHLPMLADSDSNSCPDLMIHLVSTLSRRHMSRGKITLLLPCFDDDAGTNSPISSYLESPGGWALPTGLIAREIEQRLGEMLRSERQEDDSSRFRWAML